MVYAQPRIRPGEWDAQTPLGFWDTNGPPNLGQTTRPYNKQQQQQQQQQQQRTWQIVDFAVLADHRVKLKESEKKDKYLDLAKELKKLWNMKVTVISIVIGVLCRVTTLVKKTRRLGHKRTSRNNSNYSIVEIDQNIKKSQGDLRRLVVSQTSVKNHQLTLMWKTTQECCEQYWTSPGGNTPQGTNYTANCLPSRKLYKLDEPDTQDIAGEARTNSSVMYSYGPPHMAKQKQDDQLEHT